VCVCVCVCVCVEGRTEGESTAQAPNVEVAATAASLYRRLRLHP
jgi:hypothetical protein